MSAIKSICDPVGKKQEETRAERCPNGTDDKSKKIIRRAEGNADACRETCEDEENLKFAFFKPFGFCALLVIK